MTEAEKINTITDPKHYYDPLQPQLTDPSISSPLVITAELAQVQNIIQQSQIAVADKQ